MDRQNRKLGKKLVGYNKDQVESYLNQLNQYNTTKIDEVKRLIDERNKEKERLNSELLEKEEEAKKYAKSEKYMELALKRTDGTISFMEVAANNESKDIDELGKMKLEQYNHEIEKMVNQIKIKQEQLNFLSQRLIKSSRNNHKSIEEERPNVTNHRPRKKEKGGFWEDSIETRSESDNKTQLRLNAYDKREEEYTQREKEAVSGSPALSEDINMIRNKYLIGKIAGDDLYDREGSIIISKGSVITADVVKISEQEGKLAELVVNMLLPGMEN